MRFAVRVPPRSRRVGLIAVVAAVAGGLAVLGTGAGHPTQGARLLSGAAWLSSSKVGQVTLLDGSSAEVSAQVQVSPAGNLMDVVQQGPTAYVVDQTEGTVRRVDGANFEASAPEKPIPDVHAGLIAIPGPDALYALDTQRGILATTDPQTLSRRGELQSLANKLSTGTAVVDDAGALWAVDTETGDLTHISGGAPSIRRQVAQPGPSLLTVANGHPVLVDTAGREVIGIDRDTGRVGRTIDLDLRKDDTIQVSGSAHTERLYVVNGRGALNICDLAQGRCDNAIPLKAGSEFGAAVEAGNRLFVPNYTTGEVWIVDLSTTRITAKPTVITPAGKFQLLTRDGMVFYNDLNSERAGVIHLDGTISKAAKYDPANPAKGTTNPNPGTGPQQPNPPQINQPGPNEPRQPDPNNPRQPDPKNPRQPDPNDPAPPPPANPGDPPPPTLEIKANPATPMVNEVVTLKVTSTPATTLSNVEWNFGDGSTGGGELTSHKWTAVRPNPYNVSVTALANGKQVSASVNVTVTAIPTHTLTVTVFDGGGTVTDGRNLNCSTKCTVTYEENTQITLTATPSGGNSAGPWTGDCSGSGTRCDITLNADKNVTYTFTKPAPVTLTVTPPNGGIITGDGGLNCPGVCTVQYAKGTRVQLQGRPNSGGYEFGTWGGACAGPIGASCALTMDGDKQTSATFKAELIINVQDAPSGWITYPFNNGRPNQCNEGRQCVVPYDIGQTITLQAFDNASGPINRPVFSQWSGDCSGGNRSCTLTMDRPKTVNGSWIIMG